MQRSIQIDGRVIGSDAPPYVIAELSGNHNGDLQSAFSLMDSAKNAGASAIKLQTYRPDTITMKSDAPEFFLTEGLWAGRTLYDLYEWAHTPWEWHAELFAYADKIGITLFSSPFDFTAIDLLEDLQAPAYKIASFEAVDLPLIKYAASTGKPLIISTGIANAEEIAEAIEAAKDGGCQELAILHCVSSYPAPAGDYNLRTIIDMQQRFQLPVGLSDHTLNNTTAIASVALGACIIEKHLTLDRTRGGPDDVFSLEPDDFKTLCQDSFCAWQAMGCIDYGHKPSEKQNVQFRRSLYFVQDLKAGEKITDHHVKSIRPGFGLPPKRLYEVIGRRVTQDVCSGTPVRDDLLRVNECT